MLYHSAASSPANSSSSTTSHDEGKEYFFSFEDMDDTLLDLQSNTIKNPHLTGPLLLWLTHSPKQEIGILTNRPPQDDTVPFSVKHFLNEVAEFGICIPQEQIIFAGGENNAPFQAQYSQLTQSIMILTEQLKSLALTDLGPSVPDEITRLQTLKDQIEKTKYHGKNFHIINFLNSRFRKESQTYQFAKGTCTKENLVLILTDDGENIAPPTNNLGVRFLGILASKGGNILSGADRKLWLQTDYLVEHAKIVGFDDYAKSVLTQPEIHETDHPMRLAAALLYCWQVYPSKCSVTAFINLEKILKDKEYLQVANLLQYIHLYANKDPLTSYRPVDELLALFSLKADRIFLEGALEELTKVEREIARLLSQSITTDEQQESQKSKGITSFLFRRSSQRAPLPQAQLTKENDLCLKVLYDRKLKICERIHALVTSSVPDIALLAKSKHLAIISQSDVTFGQSSYQAPLATPSSSTSTSSATMSTLERRASYTPQGATVNSSNQFRSASTTDLYRLESEDKKDKKDKNGKKEKKTGSHM